MTQATLPKDWLAIADETFTEQREIRGFSWALFLSVCCHFLFFFTLDHNWTERQQEVNVAIPVTISMRYENSVPETPVVPRGNDTSLLTRTPTMSALPFEHLSARAPTQPTASATPLKQPPAEKPPQEKPPVISAPSPAPVPPPKPTPLVAAKPPAPTPSPAPTNENVSALLHEGVNGKPLEPPSTSGSTNNRQLAPHSLVTARDNYATQAFNRINQFKRYPADAEARKQDGVVTLSFVVDHSGRVLDAWIEKASGYQLLDSATLEMIRAASPLPPLPESYKDPAVRFIMNVNYQSGR